MNYQWYPGHMTKAVRMIKEDISLIDLIIEIVDARIPFSSRNPDIDELGKNKARIIVLNKADLADIGKTNMWETYFKEKGFFVLSVNAKTGDGIRAIVALTQVALKDKIERDKKRGIKNRPVRAIVVGIPNVGKSTFINALAKKACTKTGNKPGVTKGKQWIKINQSLELLDTPGILWPKFEDQKIGMRLAFIGSINDEIIIKEEMCLDMIHEIVCNYQNALEERYQINYKKGDLSKEETHAILEDIAKARMCFLKGEEIDIKRAAGILIDDFRCGKLGRMTLEVPE